MVTKFKRYHIILREYDRAKSGQEKKIILFNQRKHLSKMVLVDKKKHGFLRAKFDELVKWYDEFTGMDEIRTAHNRVLEDEENFRKSQEDRRYVLQELKDIQRKLKDLYAELETTNRGEDRYVHLVTEEHKLLKEEKIILDKFAVAEKNERDSFAALSSSVKLSHEKERAQSERTKYWSIIGSVLGTIIGILGTSINNHFKMNELKQLIKNSSDKQLIENLKNYLDANENLLIKFKESAVKTQCINDNFNVKFEDLVSNLNSRLSKVETSINNFENNNQKKGIDIQEEYKNDSGETLGETLKKELRQTKLFILTLAVLSILVPIITKST